MGVVRTVAIAAGVFILSVLASLGVLAVVARRVDKKREEKEGI